MTQAAPFNETEWLRLLFLINDTAAWVQELEKNLLYQLPLSDKCKLYRKTYYLPASALAHLLEKHYYKIARHPGCGKFIITIPEIVHYIKEAFTTEAQPITGSLNFKRCMETGSIIGFNKEGVSTTVLTVITDAAGVIKTAFPGVV